MVEVRLQAEVSKAGWAPMVGTTVAMKGVGAEVRAVVAAAAVAPVAALADNGGAEMLNGVPVGAVGGRGWDYGNGQRGTAGLSGGIGKEGSRGMNRPIYVKSE